MPTLKAIVVDDDTTRDTRYHALFDQYFDLTIEHSVSKLRCAFFSQFDLIILDAFIGDLKAIELITLFKLTLQPIVIVSSKWVDDVHGNPTSDLLQYARCPNVIRLLSLDGLTTEAADSIYLSYINYVDIDINPLKDDDTLTILHISDMQFGGRTPGSSSNDYAVIATELKKKSLIPKIVAISGDISNSGIKSEYDDAIVWIENLCKKMWGKESLTDEDRERIIHVPGNHDYDLSLTASCEFKYVFTKHRRKTNICFEKCKHINENQRYGFNNYWDFAHRLAGNIPCINRQDQILNINNHFASWNIKFFLMNSVINIDNQNCENALAYTDYSRNEDNAFLPVDKHEGDFTNILLTHNTPNDFGFRNTESGRMSNWCKIRNMIENNKINIMLCGHSHDCNRAYILGDEHGAYSDKLICTDAPTVRLNAASRAEDATRGFNIITLYRENGRAKACAFKKFTIEHAEVKESHDKYERFDLTPIT